MSENAQENSTSQNAINVLSSILSSPNSISKMRDIISKYTNDENRDSSPQENELSSTFSKSTSETEDLNNNISDKSPTEENKESSDSSHSSPLDIMSIFQYMSNGKNDNNDKHTALLLAVRPYLSKRRQELLDTLISIGKIGKIFMDTQ